MLECLEVVDPDLQMGQLQVTNLGEESMGTYLKVTEQGVTASCTMVDDEITCEEDYADNAYLRFTKGVLNIAIIVPVDVNG